MVPAASVIARLQERCPSLRSVQGAIELSAILAAKPQLAAGQAQAYVVPSGLKGGGVQSSIGAFVQNLEAQVSVYLAFATTGDRKGSHKVDSVDEVQFEVIRALAGWGPDTAPGEFRVLTASIVRFEPGIIVTVVEFAIGDQLRILA